MRLDIKTSNTRTGDRRGLYAPAWKKIHCSTLPPAPQRKECCFDDDEMAHQNHCWTWYTEDGTHEKCSERDRHRRRNQAERARARANHFPKQLIRITVSAISVVHCLVIQFNNQQGKIDLGDYQDLKELEDKPIQETENEFIHLLYNIMYAHCQLQQPIEFYLIILCQTRVQEPYFADGINDMDDMDAGDYPGIQSNEDVGSYQLRTHVFFAPWR